MKYYSNKVKSRSSVCVSCVGTGSDFFAATHPSEFRDVPRDSAAADDDDRRVKEAVDDSRDSGDPSEITEPDLPLSAVSLAESAPAQ